MIVYLKHMWMLLIIVSIPTVFALYLTARVVCGHFLELAKQPFAGGIIRSASFFGHGTLQSGLLHAAYS